LPRNIQVTTPSAGQFSLLTRLT